MTANSGASVAAVTGVPFLEEETAPNATVVLTDAATVNWTPGNGPVSVASITLGGSRTFAAPSPLIDGGLYILKVKQDATGSRVITWNSIFKWPAATAPTLSTAAGYTDILTFVSDGANLLNIATLTKQVA